MVFICGLKFKKIIFYFMSSCEVPLKSLGTIVSIWIGELFFLNANVITIIKIKNGRRLLLINVLVVNISLT